MRLYFHSPVWLVVTFHLLGLIFVSTAQGQVNFAKSIAPILEQRCLSCHSADQQQGGFSLQDSASFFAAQVVEKNNAKASYLIELVLADDASQRMPKDADALSDDQILTIRRWIDEGAVWPEEFELSAPKVADLQWWSLLPMEKPHVPTFADPANPKAWNSKHDGSVEASNLTTRLPIRNPIDAFVQATLDRKGLTASPEADRKTILRRLYFDLIGLPPTPKEIEVFLNDEAEDAYEKVVERLLASPSYGEHWARHWLDVVHYADTHGYDKDKVRPNAWPYRDYVIRSLNSDKPYGRFVQEQIAGDVLWPTTVDGLVGPGFIAAGPWDLIGHEEVPESKLDGKVARNLDRDDMVTTTMNSFCSVTVQCARCHNHKFDPVTQEHYYSLQAVFAALDRADRPYDSDPAVAKKRSDLAKAQAELLTTKMRLQEELSDRVLSVSGVDLAVFEQEIQELETASQQNGNGPQFGYHSQVESKQNVQKWVQVDLGAVAEITSIVFVGCHDDFGNIGAGFGFPVRFRVEVCNDAQFTKDVKTVVDHTEADVVNPGTTPQVVSWSAPMSARFVRVTATQLGQRSNDYIFALGELMVMDRDGVNIAAGKAVAALDSIEAPVRWQKQNLVDNYYFGKNADSTIVSKLVQLKKERETLIQRCLGGELKTAIEVNQNQIVKNDTAITNLPQKQMVYAGVVHSGGGNFVGTGVNGGIPRPVHVLHRGDIQNPRQEVTPGTIPIIEGHSWQFRLPVGHSEGQRRVALASWVVDRDNPLTWRSIVNRIWGYHFGRGIVDSPNDFGRMGQLPTHPELLDWLAIEFRDGGQSVKHLHRLIVNSSVYRQASHQQSENSEIDKENQFLWRMNRRRLTAEEIRDTTLVISGKLDPTMYGPGYELFVMEQPENSPHYEYDLHDPNDVRSHRRSIYRKIVRSQPDPFMATLDCADSSQSVPKRDETLTALQALSLLNNKFMLTMSENFSQRLQFSHADRGQQIRMAYWEIAGQEPTDQQLEALVEYADEFGMANLCRVLLNLNSFVFVD